VVNGTERPIALGGDRSLSWPAAIRAFQFGQKKFLFDSILATESIFFDSIRQSDKFAACTLIYK